MQTFFLCPARMYIKTFALGTEFYGPLFSLRESSRGPAIPPAAGSP